MSEKEVEQAYREIVGTYSFNSKFKEWLASSRVGFDLFNFLFEHFNTKIVVISEVGNPKLDSEEVFEEIVSLLHCYSMKLYSRRKKKVVEDLITQGDDSDE